VSKVYLCLCMKDIVVLLEDQLKPLVQAELSVLVSILHHPEYLFERGSEGWRKCESGGFISKWVGEFFSCTVPTLFQWTTGGNIIRTVLCCIVHSYDSCLQCCAHTCERFLNLHVGLGLDLCVLCVCLGLVFCFFCINLDRFIPVLLAFVMLDLFF